jgi:hypothetical protein
MFKTENTNIRILSIVTLRKDCSALDIGVIEMQFR